MTETYVCPNCTEPTDRHYRVQFFSVTCPACDEHGRFVHESLLAVLDGIPADERPDNWDSLPLDERLLRAVRDGVVEYSETKVN
jgi:hypothetical protein